MSASDNVFYVGPAIPKCEKCGSDMVICPYVGAQNPCRCPNCDCPRCPLYPCQIMRKIPCEVVLK